MCLVDDVKKSLGLVHVYTGNGKGKTSAALGLAMRALEHGLTVHMLQFLKGGTYTGELSAQDKFNGFSIEQFGKGSNEKPEYADFTPDEQDRKRALSCLERAHSVIDESDVLILDEVNVALQLGHLEVSEVMGLLGKKPVNTEVVLTGRNAPSEIMDAADYVTVMQAKRHPYDRGILGRKGIDY